MKQVQAPVCPASLRKICKVSSYWKQIQLLSLLCNNSKLVSAYLASVHSYTLYKSTLSPSSDLVGPSFALCFSKSECLPLQQAHSVIIYISYQLQTDHSYPSIINFLLPFRSCPIFHVVFQSLNRFPLQKKNSTINANYFWCIIICNVLIILHNQQHQVPFLGDSLFIYILFYTRQFPSTAKPIFLSCSALKTTLIHPKSIFVHCIVRPSWLC